MLEGVPNLAMAVGYTNASWTLKSDLTCDYVARLLNHMHRTGAVPVHAGQPRRRRSSRSPLLGLTSGYVDACRGPVPEAGLAVPVADAPELPAPTTASMKRSGLADDGALVFSRPVHAARRRPRRATAEEQPA